MVPCTLRWLACFLGFVCVGGLVWAEEPTVQEEQPTVVADEQPADKNKELAAEKVEPANENEESAAKNDESASKNGKPTDENGAKEIKKSILPPTTHTVKKGPLKVTFDLDGVFEAETAREIAVKTEEWSMLTIKSAVEHGTRVREGDVLLTLDADDLDKAIADLRAELSISEISMQQSEDQLRALEKTTPLDLEASERAARIAEEDRKYFFEVDRPFTVKMVEFSLKVARQYLEYQEEELHQLEKMYKADDITEETEEIVLQRARDSVEQAKFMVDYTKIYHDQAMKFTLPRMEDMVKESAQRTSLNWKKDKVELPLALQQQRLELEKTRVQRKRSEEKLDKLLADRKLMTVKSPIDGIVYYGECEQGKFSDSTSLADKLRPDGAILPDQVVMTVVRRRPMFIRATAPEKQLHYLRPGLTCVAIPTGYPDLRLPATIDHLDDIPMSPGNFDLRLKVTLDREAKWLVPGMTCKIKLTPYLKKDALSLPQKAVMTDELDDEKHFVYVPDKDGEPTKRDVKLGEKTDKKVEILDGLSEGDKVLREAPKDED